MAKAPLDEQERCAKIDDVWANTKQELEKSDTEQAARITTWAPAELYWVSWAGDGSVKVFKTHTSLNYLNSPSGLFLFVYCAYNSNRFALHKHPILMNNNMSYIHKPTVPGIETPGS